MRRLILGTAGHIDHGKTALVKALTGVDTDRLKEEKARGITVDLGFAELTTPGGIHFGVVDVPGHEGFIRNMVAGATGMDLVLLVVAADEGVMPQTLEHLAIVRLLGVPRLVVALTKTDLVENEWLDLVREEVRETLQDTPFPEAPILPVSAVSEEGLDDLLGALESVGSEAREKARDDLPRLPIDRVFSIRGAGTIVTGTLWTGRVSVGDRVQVLPGGVEARIRSIQLHNHEVNRAEAGARVAVGLAGTDVHHDTLSRGQNLVGGEGWEESWMLTCLVSVLADTGWVLEHGQRVRVHLGTAEVLARVALLEDRLLAGDEEGWVQLRLEAPLLARGRDHLVLRSYSPVTTIGGGRVAEPAPPKRRRLRGQLPGLLGDFLEGDEREAVAALLLERDWAGIPESSLPHRLGFPPDTMAAFVCDLRETGQAFLAQGHLFTPGVVEKGRTLVLEALGAFHRQEPLKPGMPLEELRQVFPQTTGPGLGEAVIRGLDSEGLVVREGGVARLASFQRSLSTAQEELRERIEAILQESELAPPGMDEMAEALGSPTKELEGILRFMEGKGEVVSVEGGLFFWKSHVTDAGARIVGSLAGADGLGPADFRDVLGVTRKHLLPLLRHMDTVGVTTRFGDQRTVAESLPPNWGTKGNNGS